MYEFGIGHYLLYPLGIFLFSGLFFFYGYRVGRRWERGRLTASESEASS